MEDEVIDDYRSSLVDLTCNSKPLINMLTMLAEENEQYATHIVQVIETHINQVFHYFLISYILLIIIPIIRDTFDVTR